MKYISRWIIRELRSDNYGKANDAESVKWDSAEGAYFRSQEVAFSKLFLNI
jgi:hypothetical protein